MIGQVRITFYPIFRLDKTSFHQGLTLLSFSISVLILICKKILLFACWATLKHFFFYNFPQYLKEYFVFETFSVSR